MNKVDLYIDGTRADAFNDESIEINLTTQNLQDIGSVFGDYSKGFTLPATRVNNGIFKHYYNVDIVGGFDANVRVDAFIEVNTVLFRDGKLELENVQFKNGEPYAYSVTFYGKTASLKDAFGEDQLTDLDLSIGDHTYNDFYIKSGLDGYVSATGDTVIYPLISALNNWYYNSQNTGHEEAGNIAFHSSAHDHGVYYYDLKPAIKLKAILDAIESDYGITFNSDLFDSADFAKLFMWCHRKEGYMFKDQLDGYPAKQINFITGTNFNLVRDYYEVTSALAVYGNMRINYTVNFVSGSECELYVYKKRGENPAEKIATQPITGGTTSFVYVYDLQEDDQVSFYFAPKPNWAGGSLEIELNVEGLQPSFPFTSEFAAQTAGTLQTFTTEVVIAEQMPEQKIIDFLRGLVKMFNLVIIYEGNNTYKLEPLDDWYADGNTIDITRYIDTTEFSANRPELYRRIEFSYQETEAIAGETYRNTSGGGVGYGDVRADFAFDGGEFKVESTFEHMLFERLVDSNDSIQTDFAIGQAIDKDLKGYVGAPFVFYAPTLTPTLTKTVAYVNTGGTSDEIDQFWLVSNCNDLSGEDITKTLNYGTEIDPYTGANQTGGLYETYWLDYVTDLYSSARRVYNYKAIFPLDVILKLNTNDKLTIVDRDYIINNVSLDLMNGQATLELLNDV